MKKRKELDDKIDKLHDFYMSDKYQLLPERDHQLMGSQLYHMKIYSDALRERIQRFK